MMHRLVHLYQLDEGKVEGVDPYFAQALAFGLDHEVCYLFGQLTQKPMTAEQYGEQFERLRSIGFKKFIYASKRRRKILGGEPLHPDLPGFWIADL